MTNPYIMRSWRSPERAGIEFKLGLLVILLFVIAGCGDEAAVKKKEETVQKKQEVKDRIKAALNEDVGLVSPYLSAVEGKLDLTVGEGEELLAKARQRRLDFIVYLEGIEPELDFPARQATIEYFQAENAFLKTLSATVVAYESFNLAEENWVSCATEVDWNKRGAKEAYLRKSKEYDQSAKEAGELLGEAGRKLLAAHDVLLSTQNKVLPILETENISMRQLWSKTQQAELLETTREMIKKGENRGLRDEP